MHPLSIIIIPLPDRGYYVMHICQSLIIPLPDRDSCIYNAPFVSHRLYLYQTETIMHPLSIIIIPLPDRDNYVMHLCQSLIIPLPDRGKYLMHPLWVMYYTVTRQRQLHRVPFVGQVLYRYKTDAVT